MLNPAAPDGNPRNAKPEPRPKAWRGPFPQKMGCTLPHDRPADRHPLPLAARKFARVSSKQIPDVQQIGCPPDSLIEFRFRGFPRFESKGDVFVNRQIRVERV